MKFAMIIPFAALLAVTSFAFCAKRSGQCAPCSRSSFTCRPTPNCPCLFQQAALERESASYTLKFQLPEGLELTQPWTAFYQGQPIQFDGPSFVWALLPEHASYEHALRDHESRGDESTGIFSLVITPQVTFTAEGNTIKWLQRIKGKPFRWFDLTQASLSESLSLRSEESYAGQAPSRKKSTWVIKELSKDEAPLQLPDHAIVLLLDPKFVSELSEAQQPCAGRSIASHFIPLPTIKITTKSEEALNDACAQAALGAVDLRTIHQKQPLQIRQSQKAIMSLATPQ